MIHAASRLRGAPTITSAIAGVPDCLAGVALTACERFDTGFTQLSGYTTPPLKTVRPVIPAWAPRSVPNAFLDEHFCCPDARPGAGGLLQRPQARVHRRPPGA